MECGKSVTRYLIEQIVSQAFVQVKVVSQATCSVFAKRNVSDCFPKGNEVQRFMGNSSVTFPVLRGAANSWDLMAMKGLKRSHSHSLPLH